MTKKPVQPAEQPPVADDTAAPKRTPMEVVGNIVDGAAIGVTGGPFGLILDELRPTPDRPSPSGNKWFLLFPADDDNKDVSAVPPPIKTPTVATTEKSGRTDRDS